MRKCVEARRIVGRYGPETTRQPTYRSFLDEARDVLEISRDIEDHGRSNVREAQRSLGAHLDVLRSHGILVFGGRERMVIAGGHLPPAPFVVAHLLAVQATDPRIATQ